MFLSLVSAYLFCFLRVYMCGACARDFFLFARVCVCAGTGVWACARDFILMRTCVRVCWHAYICALVFSVSSSHPLLPPSASSPLPLSPTLSGAGGYEGFLGGLHPDLHGPAEAHPDAPNLLFQPPCHHRLPRPFGPPVRPYRRR